MLPRGLLQPVRTLGLPSPPPPPPASPTPTPTPPSPGGLGWRFPGPEAGPQVRVSGGPRAKTLLPTPSRLCQKTHWPDHKSLCRPENIGYPFLVSVPASRLTYARLAQLLEGYAR